MTYIWRKDGEFHKLAPKLGPKCGAQRRDAVIASILVGRDDRRGLKAFASYEWASTGNKPTGWAEFKSVAQAKRWVEAQLAKFWEPPSVGTG